MAAMKRRCITFSYGGKRYYCYGKTLLIASEKAAKRKAALQNL